MAVISLLLSALLLGCQQGQRNNEVADALSRLEQRRQKARLLNEQGLAAATLEERHRLFARAVELDAMLGPAHHNLGVTLFHQEAFYEAAQHLQQAANLLDAAPTPRANLAVLHAKLAQWPRALEYARQAKQRDTTDPLTLRVLARALMETGEDDDELQQILKRIARRDPTKRWREWAIAEANARLDRQSIWE